MNTWNTFDTATKVVVIFFGIFAVIGVPLMLRGKLEEYHVNRRGWRLWVHEPFFRYLEKDSSGRWTAIDFEATWESHGHWSVLKSVRLRAPSNWYKEPEWAALHRARIIARLRASYPNGVEFVEELNQPHEPSPSATH